MEVFDHALVCRTFSAICSTAVVARGPWKSQRFLSIFVRMGRHSLVKKSAFLPLRNRHGGHLRIIVDTSKDTYTWTKDIIMNTVTTMSCLCVSVGSFTEGRSAGLFVPVRSHHWGVALGHCCSMFFMSRMRTRDGIKMDEATHVGQRCSLAVFFTLRRSFSAGYCLQHPFEQNFV